MAGSRYPAELMGGNTGIKTKDTDCVVSWINLNSVEFIRQLSDWQTHPLCDSKCN